MDIVITLLKNWMFYKQRPHKNICQHRILSISLYIHRTGWISSKEGGSCIHPYFWLKKFIKTTALFPKLLGLCCLKAFIILQCRHILFLSIHRCHILNLLALSQTPLPHQKDTPLTRLCLH